MIEKAQIALNRLFVKGTSDKGSEATEEHFIGNWRKDDPCYIMAEGLSELSPTVVWKVEFVSDKLDYIELRFPSKVLVIWPSFFLSLQ